MKLKSGTITKKFKKLISLILVSVFAVSAVSCGSTETEDSEEFYTASFFAMSTEAAMKLSKESKKANSEGEFVLSDKELEKIAADCADIAVKYENLFSRTIEASAVSEINTEADYFLEIDPELEALISKSKEISKATDGSFDISIGTVTELWNITGETPHVPNDEELTEALSHVGYSKITTDGVSLSKTDRKTKIDLGAIAKGYALGKIIDYLNESDVSYGFISFGGNVAVFGKKPDGTSYKVGIRETTDENRVSSYVYIDSGYVSVSGDYERFYEENGVKYNHIFDPATGKPAQTDISGVAVICEDSSLADALSTALFVMGSEKAIEFYNSEVYEFEAVIETSDGELIVTDGLNDGAKFEKYVEPDVNGQN